MSRFRPWLRDRFTDAVVRSPGLTKSILRAAGSPRIAELYTTARSWHSDPASMLSAAFGTSATEVTSILDEARSALTEIQARATAVGRNYPSFYPVGGHTALAVFAAVRIVRPEVLLETGVADGLSTAIDRKSVV